MRLLRCIRPFEKKKIFEENCTLAREERDQFVALFAVKRIDTHLNRESISIYTFKHYISTEFWDSEPKRLKEKLKQIRKLINLPIGIGGDTLSPRRWLR